MDVRSLITKLEKLGDRHSFNVHVVIFDEDLNKDREIYSVEYNEDSGIPVIMITLDD